MPSESENDTPDKTLIEQYRTMMTIRRFERIVEAGPFRIERLQTVPIHKLRPLHSRLTRELTTAIVRCRLGFIK